MPTYRGNEDALSRRTILYGLGALAGHSLLSGCGGDAARVHVSQPVPNGPLTQGSVTVSGSSGASVGAAFTGLSYEKGYFSSEPLFVGTNANLIGMFKRLGTSLLRIGGNSVDETVWNAGGPGQTAGQVAPEDVDGLAAFLQATGWKCLYGVNLGGAATGGRDNSGACGSRGGVCRPGARLQLVWDRDRQRMRSVCHFVLSKRVDAVRI